MTTAHSEHSEGRKRRTGLNNVPRYSIITVCKFPHTVEFYPSNLPWRIIRKFRPHAATLVVPWNVINALLIQYLAPCVSRACGDKEEERGTWRRNESEDKMPENHQRISVGNSRRVTRRAHTIETERERKRKRERERERERERAARFDDFASIRQWIILHFVLYRVRRTLKLAHSRWRRVTLIRKILFLSLNRNS